MTKHVTVTRHDVSYSTAAPRRATISLADDGMGAAFAASHVRPRPTPSYSGWTAEQARACRALWASVLMTAIRDALAPDEKLQTRNGNHGSASKLDRAQAQSWVGSKDFRIVCEAAGLNPDYILAAYRAGKIKRGDLAPVLTRYTYGKGEAKQ